MELSRVLLTSRRQLFHGPLGEAYWAEVGLSSMPLPGSSRICTRDGIAIFRDLRFSEGMPVRAKDFSQS